MDVGEKCIPPSISNVPTQDERCKPGFHCVTKPSEKQGICVPKCEIDFIEEFCPIHDISKPDENGWCKCSICADGKDDNI